MFISRRIQTRDQGGELRKITKSKMAKRVALGKFTATPFFEIGYQGTRFCRRTICVCTCSCCQAAAKIPLDTVGAT